MSYPPPPGLRPTVPANPQPQSAHSSLPPRPPPSITSSHIPSRSLASYGLAFQPRSINAQTYSQPSNVPTSFLSNNPAPKPPPTAFSTPQPDALGLSGIMPIQNPFPLPNQPNSDRLFTHGQEPADPELEAQIAQWQSTYASKDNHNTTSTRTYNNNKWSDSVTGLPSANTLTPGPRFDNRSSANGAGHTDSGVAEVVTAADGKQKTVVRQGGGQSWQDPSLLEWDPAHFRLFVGNLAGEVTDDSLLKAFIKYTSVQKARVVRDKRTTKSKGYGFVSFSDGDDYFQAARDMQGKYIGSHPVLLRKSTTEIRPTAASQAKGSRRGKGVNGSSSTGAGNSHGIHKKQNKNRNGLKILG